MLPRKWKKKIVAKIPIKFNVHGIHIFGAVIQDFQLKKNQKQMNPAANEFSECVCLDGNFSLYKNWKCLCRLFVKGLPANCVMFNCYGKQKQQHYLHCQRPFSIYLNIYLYAWNIVSLRVRLYVFFLKNEKHSRIYYFRFRKHEKNMNKIT